MNNKVNKWGIEHSNFQIEFQHIRGKCVMADALSHVKRLGLYTPQEPEPNDREFGHTILEELPPIKVSQIQAYAKPVPPRNWDSEDILKQQCNDELCNQIKQNLDLSKYQDYKLEDGLLYKGTKIKDQMFDAAVIPSKQKSNILIAAHENLGHMGITKTYAFLPQQYFWPKMKKQFTHHIHTCEQCAQENQHAPPQP